MQFYTKTSHQYLFHNIYTFVSMSYYNYSSYMFQGGSWTISRLQLFVRKLTLAYYWKFVDIVIIALIFIIFDIFTHYFSSSLVSFFNDVFRLHNPETKNDTEAAKKRTSTRGSFFYEALEIFRRIKKSRFWLCVFENRCDWLSCVLFASFSSIILNTRVWAA